MKTPEINERLTLRTNWDNSTCATALWRDKIGLALPLRLQRHWLDRLRAGNRRSALKISLNHSSLEKKNHTFNGEEFCTPGFIREEHLLFVKGETLNVKPTLILIHGFLNGRLHSYLTHQNTTLSFSHTLHYSCINVYSSVCTVTYVTHKRQRPHFAVFLNKLKLS